MYCTTQPRYSMYCFYVEIKYGGGGWNYYFSLYFLFTNGLSISFPAQVLSSFLILAIAVLKSVTCWTRWSWASFLITDSRIYECISFSPSDFYNSPQTSASSSFAFLGLCRVPLSFALLHFVSLLIIHLFSFCHTQWKTSALMLCLRCKLLREQFNQFLLRNICTKW